MSSKIFVEGAAQGPNSKLLQSRCREGFRKLLEKCGFTGRLPQIVPCGSRGATYRDFKTAHRNRPVGSFVAMLVDSEDPIEDLEQPWAHLKHRDDDNWDRPDGANDEQVLLMVTCMETWIATDRRALRTYFGERLQESALPSAHGMESRNRHVIQDSLVHATRNCTNTYQKGKRSFELLAKLDPVELRNHLPSFVRCERILRLNLS